MKHYTVYFKEPIAITYIRDRWNKKAKQWEKVEETEHVLSYGTTSLAGAKKLIKANLDKYKGSCITKIWANGDFENLGEIKIKGTNKTFVANTKQNTAGY